MYPSRLLATAFLVSVGLTTASAADLSKIDRTLKDEPTYTTRTPLFCLLVFGPEAETRVWLVHDGGILHVLDSPDGKAAPKWRQVGNNGGSFALGDIRELDGKTIHKNLRYSPSSRMMKLSVIVGGKRQIAGWDLRGKLAFANSAKEAPVVHFNGPLTLDLFHDQDPLVTGPSELTAVVGSHGVGPGTFAGFSTDAYPKGAWPTAVIEFPPKDGDKPIVVKVALAEE
jgi:hypothetical protein